MSDNDSILYWPRDEDALAGVEVDRSEDTLVFWQGVYKFFIGGAGGHAPVKIQ